MTKILLFDKKSSSVKKYVLDSDILLQLFNSKLRLCRKSELDDYETYIVHTKKIISHFDSLIPLYDIFSSSFFMIHKQNVYWRVYYNHYRFPDPELVKELSNNEQLTIILSMYSLDELYLTYSNIIHEDDLTTCKRPSFLPIFTYVKPYYTKKELTCMALNSNLKVTDELQLCSIVSQSDISAKLLLKHRSYLIKTNNINVIQYYSLNGSSHMNAYLRRPNYKNDILESNILKMWNVVHNAPALEKDHIVYRFINDDSFISELKVNDVFIDKGFVSTTRNPFYQSDKYIFGFVLMKINLPKNIKGIGLSVESFSNFPTEQEIILPPYTKLKLVNKDTDCKYYHIDDQINAQIVKKYEFDLIDIEHNIQIKDKRQSPDSPKHIDFMKTKLTSETTNDKILEFQSNCINQISQFTTTIGKQIFTLSTEWYNSTQAYKDFFAIYNKNGFSVYCFHNTKLLFVLEIMELLHELHVNYYFRYSDNSELYNIIPQHEFVLFLCKFSFMLNIQRIIIYNNYKFCLKQGNEMSLGSFRTDFQMYFENKSKQYGQIIHIQPKFNYRELDNLRTVPCSKILNVHDSDELYQIWITSKVKYVAEFYIYIIRHHCNMLATLEIKMKRLYTGLLVHNNPFIFSYYTLEPYIYLYDNGLIGYLPKVDSLITGPIIETLPTEEDVEKEIVEHNRMPFVYE